MDCFVLAEHLLMVTAALDRTTSPYFLTHHAMNFYLLEFLDIKVEEIFVFLQKGNISDIFLQIPLKSLAFLAGSSRPIGWRIIRLNGVDSRPLVLLVAKFMALKRRMKVNG